MLPGVELTILAPGRWGLFQKLEGLLYDIWTVWNKIYIPKFQSDAFEGKGGGGLVALTFDSQKGIRSMKILYALRASHIILTPML